MIELMSPALVDGFFTTEPPGKPISLFFFVAVVVVYGLYYVEEREAAHSSILGLPWWLRL